MLMDVQLNYVHEEMSFSCENVKETKLHERNNSRESERRQSFKVGEEIKNSK